jgi:hypothetical protein
VAPAASGPHEEPWFVGLLSGEPPGLIATRTAGVAEFRAALSWFERQELYAPSVAGASLVPPLECARRTVAEDERTLLLEERVLAPTESELGYRLGALMRAAAQYAALSGAVLEASVVRVSPPRVASRPALEALARDLWLAGFAVRFAPSEAPSDAAGAADVWVGTGGAEGELREYLLSHPRWKTA